jgi:very-short-patch-repair endonuclease
VSNKPLFRPLLRREGIPQPVSEFRFHPVRRFRFDFAWPDKLVALEVDGGLWLRGGGRHNRASGFIQDTVKTNLAASLGWRVLRVTPQQLCDLQTIALIRETLNYKRAA